MPENTEKGDERSATLRHGLLSSTIVLTVIVICICAAGYLIGIFAGSSVHPALIGAITVVAALIVAVFGAVRIARRHAAPIEDLAAQATRFAQGDFGVTFKADGASTEVGELADSMNAITRSTRSALAELKTEEQRQRQFVSDVSHEIRTPLTSIRGNAETMLDPDMPPEMRERFLGIIIDECDRLTRLANDLLELNRIESTDKLDLVRIDLHRLAESVVKMLGPLFEDREVEVTLSGEAPDILGDEDKIKQVLVNLLENASRFAKRRVHVELAGIKGQSVITVTDDGDGFGDIDPARLFDRFYRGDKSRASATGGAGLGLAIVKSIVTAHDGSVEAFNVPNGGACFAVGFPSVAPQ